MAGETPEAVDRRNEAIVADLAVAGDVLLTSTVIHGRYAIRLCILNHSSDWSDVERALERVASTEVINATGRSAATSGADRAARQAAVAGGWPAIHEVVPAVLRSVSAFGSLTDEQAVRFLGTAREEEYVEGQALIARWALARTFYILLEGRLSVRIGNREVNVLEPGDHFGEIAAIDWGRDFSYGRTATVEAVQPSRVLAFPAAALRELRHDAPDVDRAIRLVAQVRLGSQ